MVRQFISFNNIFYHYCLTKVHTILLDTYVLFLSTYYLFYLFFLADAFIRKNLFGIEITTTAITTPINPIAIAWSFHKAGKTITARRKSE